MLARIPHHNCEQSEPLRIYVPKLEFGNKEQVMSAAVGSGIINHSQALKEQRQAGHGNLRTRLPRKCHETIANQGQFFIDPASSSTQPGILLHWVQTLRPIA